MKTLIFGILLIGLSQPSSAEMISFGNMVFERSNFFLKVFKHQDNIAFDFSYGSQWNPREFKMVCGVKWDQDLVDKISTEYAEYVNNNTFLKISPPLMKFGIYDTCKTLK